jgi:hypothetical protein
VEEEQEIIVNSKIFLRFSTLISDPAEKHLNISFFVITKLNLSAMEAENISWVKKCPG